MKFSGTVDINKPIDEVVNLFMDKQYMGEYQKGFLRKEVISGKEGHEGAISKIYYQYGKQEMEITETVVSNQLPNSIEVFCHHKHMDNTLKTCFESLDNGKTRYKMEGEYVIFRGFMPKLLKILSPSLFKKEPQKWMDNFKLFVEKL